MTSISNSFCSGSMLKTFYTHNDRGTEKRVSTCNIKIGQMGCQEASGLWPEPLYLYNFGMA